MDVTPILVCVIVVLGVTCCALAAKLWQIKNQSVQIIAALDDAGAGNVGRRVLAHGEKITDEICYKINHLVQTHEEQLSRMEKTERANQQLMTSLSHDVRTPLTTLIGYLDAIQDNVVVGRVREEYIHSAHAKAYTLKGYTDDLFEWFKLASGERQYEFEKADVGELSRRVLADWIPRLEEEGFSYSSDITSVETLASVDIAAYYRILNNLIQNAVEHSGGSHIGIAIDSDDSHICIRVCDDGKGIESQHLPHIFERLYKGDDARTNSGSGLGLSIVSELVRALNATIAVECTPAETTVFTLRMEKAR